jgi:chromosome segregation ATPase
MSIDPSLAAIIGSIITGSTVWGGTWLLPRVTRKQIKQQTAKAKAETDSQVVASALDLTEALEKHANNLRLQLDEHERRSQEREARYETKIAHLESNWDQEKKRCDSLEAQVKELTTLVNSLQREIASFQI